jgi:hypothetical protein
VYTTEASAVSRRHARLLARASRDAPYGSLQDPARFVAYLASLGVPDHAHRGHGRRADADVHWLTQKLRLLTVPHMTENLLVAMGLEMFGQWRSSHLETLYINTLYASTMLQGHLMTADGLPAIGGFRLGAAWP